MRVADLDRDMRDVVPTGSGVDSEFLFARMTDVTLDWAEAAPGRRILDVASGFGNDTIRLAGDGAEAVGIEPSSRMLALARDFSAKAAPPKPHWIQAWSDALPFADASFDAVVCKGSIDHFDRPELAIAEMARVTRPSGRVVLAIANFESLTCRLSRGLDALREVALRRPVRPGRRLYDVPSDHFTRYDPELMREQASRSLDLERVEGISLFWGFRGWSALLARLPRRGADALVQGLNAVARWRPGLADVLVLVGRPRRSASSSR